MTYIIVYSLDGCRYSKDAVKILKKYHIPRKIINVPNEESLKSKYKKINGMATFPQIFMHINNDDIKIGGYNDLSELVYDYSAICEKNCKVDNSTSYGKMVEFINEYVS
ncbi:MAG: hypothetical protein Faunusvirus1_12 [Faunusvirus sp.]|jgi:glutaredoxin|uniref:Glutaredoxin domain-containing protein n=1 Tax=Faunusvirus sp. TaxID=2487766 RepID=A0A3G4ZVR4_9VIRU|nr:MAG: hypothetical protein Faunusvirus1_12 [Faunusvirus sp.]